MPIPERPDSIGRDSQIQIDGGQTADDEAAGTNRGGPTFNPAHMRRSDVLRGQNVPDGTWGTARSLTWHALRFGGDRLAARLAIHWSRHGAAWASWGSKRTGRGFSLWQSVQFCCCRRQVSRPRSPGFLRASSLDTSVLRMLSGSLRRSYPSLTNISKA